MATQHAESKRHLGGIVGDEAIEEYKRCKLVARRSGGIYKGKAWKGNLELAAADGQSTSAVLEKLRGAVDERVRIEKAGKKMTYPSASDYTKAFVAVQNKLPDAYIAMLRAHYFAARRTQTARQLAQAAKYKDWQSANLHYGTLGKIIGEELMFQPAFRTGTTDPIWTRMLAIPADQQEGISEAEFQWQMREEVARALEEVGIVAGQK
jgi:hypothetical protein